MIRNILHGAKQWLLSYLLWRLTTEMKGKRNG